MWTLQKRTDGPWSTLRADCRSASLARIYATRDYRPQDGRLARQYGASYRVLDPEGRPYQESLDNTGLKLHVWKRCVVTVYERYMIQPDRWAREKRR
jgi:hypothetical protein